MTHRDSINGIKSRCCILCNERLERTNCDWIMRCSACGVLQNNVRRDSENERQPELLNEEVREEGLMALRKRNFNTILDYIVKFAPPQGKTLLDVGCAHGWFLKEAEIRGYRTVGIEPDPFICSRATSLGVTVLQGYFPAALENSDTFDVICFNDVFEHLTDPVSTLKKCHQLLNNKGLLAINLPVSNGFFFRTSLLLSHLGLSSPMERMWQKNFPSPHITYFNSNQLQKFVEPFGFIELGRLRIHSLTYKGLWARITYGTNRSTLYSAIVLLGAGSLIPIIKWFPSDTMLSVFQKVD